ncbi:hypothetical protein TELCIR_10452 [Teladorsagia circumcincta]|uniref:Serpin domain-containing protein n=1 Tax=Teladorsagia circumcincta TaxID=45464 RepID=A0A2G9UC19_TELCI|nr:hypothetical protein TELCIR_10452 [Teladorsagia circumcincta]
MVQAGAKGNTKSQINSVISKGASDNEIEEHYSRLYSQIMNATGGVKSRIANGFFANKQFQIEKAYEKTIKEKYNAKVEALDFGKAKESAKVIDNFISETTAGKIHDMVTEKTVQGTLPKQVSYFVIANANC